MDEPSFRRSQLAVIAGARKTGSVQRNEMRRHRAVVERSGNKRWTHWRFIASAFLRQTFVECAGETVPHSFGAKAFLRALASKWIRVPWRCWHDRHLRRSRYLMALQKRH